jgi:DNA polymerase-3 subunit alpha
MRIAQKFAGFSLADADNLRKACLPAGSRMRTWGGHAVAIENVLGLRDRRVETVDVTTKRTCFESVDDVWSVGTKPVHRLTTSAGFTIEATDNHPFLVNGHWTELGLVRVGDRVAIAARAAEARDWPTSEHRVTVGAAARSVHGRVPDARSSSPAARRLDDPRTGDLVWDTVVSVTYVGETECFDFQMANGDRPYAVVEDFLVHNCGKKDRALIQKEREKFVAGCESTGYGADLGTKWFDIIEPFADYAFNKSHSYGYGYVAYQTAYLKANYPVEYFAALLTSVKTNLDKAAIYLNECRQIGIPVLVPDVNRSMADFVAAVDDGGQGASADGTADRVGRDGIIDLDAAPPAKATEVIPFGLSAVRNVGEALVDLIVAEREANGPYEDFYDFCDRVDTGVLNKRTIESLVKAGGFDSLGHPRQGLLAVHEQIIDRTLSRRRKEAEGQFDLFSTVADASVEPAEPRIAIPEIEFDKRQRLAFEKEMLGLYVSDHPLMGAEASLRRRTESTISELEGVEDGSLRVVGGLVTSLQRKWTKKGDLMAVFILEDLQSSIEVMVFPKTMQLYGHVLEDDAVVVVKARIDGRDDQPKLMAMEVERFEPVTDGAPPVRINLSMNALSEAMLGDLKGLLGDHPGESQVFLHLGERQVLRLADAFCVDSSGGLVGELRELLGPDAIMI